MGAGPLPWLVWVSPVGWAQQLRPFAGDRWWVLGLVTATVAALLATAARWRGRRDGGSGLLPDRPGPAHGTVRGAFGLAWRQQRGLLVAMTAGSAVLGLVLGTAVDGAAQAGPQLLPFLARLGVRDPGEALVVLLLHVFAEVLAAWTIMSVLRPRADERDGLGAVLLATPVGRVRWMSGHLLVAALGTAVIMLTLGATVGFSHGIAVGDPDGATARAVGSALAKVPAVWVVGAVAALAFGIAPRAAAAVSWTVFAAVLAVEIGWEFGRFGDTVFAVSPFSWVHPIAGRGGAGAPVGLGVVAAVLVGVGLLALRRRDIE